MVISIPKGKLRPFFYLKVASILSQATTGFNGVWWYIIMHTTHHQWDIWVLPLMTLSTPKGKKRLYLGLKIA
jgi:hypothetical protein